MENVSGGNGDANTLNLQLAAGRQGHQICRPNPESKQSDYKCEAEAGGGEPGHGHDACIASSPARSTVPVLFSSFYFLGVPRWIFCDQGET